MKKQKNKALNLKVKIISGIWRGRNINFLPKKDLRPTKNIIRETLFNWLGSDLTDLVCLDLFAGSGALGFESASRGAANVYLVDIDNDVAHCLEEQKNIRDKIEKEERDKKENERIKEWEAKFDDDQRQREDDLINKFYNEENRKEETK